MLERPKSGERSLLLHIGLKRSCYEDEIQEFRALAISAGAEIVGEVHARRDRPSPRLFVGTGKADELAEQVKETCAELALLLHPVEASPQMFYAVTEWRSSAKSLARNRLLSGPNSNRPAI